MFTLIIEDKDGAIADEYSFEEGEFIVGRSHSSDIILPADNVSRRHARLYTQDSKCYVEDLNSSNGVFVNGKRIHRVFEIVRTAQIKIGDYYLHVEGTSYAASPDPERSVEVQQGIEAQRDMGVAPLEQNSAVAEPGARLVGVNLSTQGCPFDLTGAVTLVGRGKDCGITIIDPSVSRVHAKVIRNPDGTLRVEDLRSSNGTYINDARVENGQFSHGDTVRFGNVAFMCESQASGGSEDRSLVLPGRKGLWFFVSFLVLVLVAGGITIYLLRDKLFGSGDSAADTPVVQANTSRVKSEDEQEEFDLAKKRIERFAKRARRLAGTDDWAGAQKALEKGAKELKKIASLDEKGELYAYFESSQKSLLSERKTYMEFIDALEQTEYSDAGNAYLELTELKDGAFGALARTKLLPVKEDLISRGEALCSNQIFDKCLEFYKKAKKLDPTDKELGSKVARTRLKMNKKSPNPK